MSEKSIYQKIFDAIDVAILAETGVTLKWQEAVELRGYIKSLEESYALEGNDYRAELARRDEIIKRLKEDGEKGWRLYEAVILPVFDTDIEHHRALMNELEEK